jgi:crossover junction endodeoxyribonuclease RusA
VRVIVTHYYASVSIDLDNLAKPILDAIKGIAIVDDSQVCELVLRRIAVQDALRLSLPSPLVAGALVMAPELLHVLVREASEGGVEP